MKLIRLLKSKMSKKAFIIKCLSVGLILFASQVEIFASALDEKGIMQNQISGIVTSASGEPLVGATITVKGTNTGVVTDFDGKFNLSLPNGATTLIVSYIGYTTEEIAIDNQSTFTIQLVEAADALDEVVLVGYGTKKISSVTSAVSAVNVEELGTVTTQNIAQSLQGRVPGLYIKDGGYNQGTTILIRGVTTIGNNSPLYIIDGIPQDLLTVDPNDIEAISVLKDGAASAIYGSRAAAGVIIVTTKVGKNKKATFNFESYASVGELTTVQQRVGSIESAGIMNEASINSGSTILFTPEDIAKFESGTDHDYPDVNWQDEWLKTEITQRYFLSATGGNENSSYYFSLGYRNADGVVKKGFDQTQYNLRTNLKTKLRDNIDLGVNLSYVVSDTQAPNVNGGMNSIYTHMNVTAPFLAIYKTDDPDSEFQEFNKAGAYGRGFWNALWELEAGTSNSKTKTFAANTNLAWEIFDGFKFVGRYSLLSSTYKSVSSVYKRSTSGGPVWFSDNNYMSQNWRDNNQYNAQSLLTYDKSFNKHNLSVLAGWEVQFNQDSYISAGRIGFLFDDLLTEFNSPNSSDNDDITGLSGDTYESALQSGLGRIGYNFDEKYFIELAGRYDGSSVFAPENRYGFFPAISAAWAINKENFFNSNTIDQLKFRASYGVTGNNRVNGSYYSLLGFGSYYFGAGTNTFAQPTFQEGSIPFRDLKWETTHSMSIAADFSIKNGLLAGSLEFYNKITNDILLPSPVPGTVGTYRSGPAINAGNVKNSGVEIMLSHNNEFSNGFKYGVSVNGSYNINEITELTDAFSEFSTSYRVGDEMGSVYGFVSDGILTTQSEVDAYKAAITSGVSGATTMGDISYVDQNGDGKLDFEDRVVIAETLPKINYGINLNAEWKNFDLQLFFQGTSQSKQHKSNDLFGNQSWIPEEAKDAWSPSNVSGSYPRLLLYGNQTYFQNFYTTSTFWTFNSSYFRMKNLQLGYTVPMQQNKVLDNARIYFTGTNVFTVSDFRPGFDPESNGLYMPPLKTFSLGINIHF